MSEPFLSVSQKDSLANQFFNTHLTFGRPITIWRNAEQIVLATNPSNNYLFEAAPFNDVTQPVLVSGTFLARVRYPKQEMQEPFSTTYQGQGADQVSIRREDGDVRIVVDATGAAYLFDAQRITFDDEIFDIESTKRPHGLFNTQFYDFTLKKLN